MLTIDEKLNFAGVPAVTILKRVDPYTYYTGGYLSKSGTYVEWPEKNAVHVEGYWDFEVTDAGIFKFIEDDLMTNFAALKKHIMREHRLSLFFTSVEWDRRFAQATQFWHTRGMPGLVTAEESIKQYEAGVLERLLAAKQAGG